MICTGPDMDILKELRMKAWIVAEPTAPHGIGKPERLAKLYRKRIAPSGRVYVHKLRLRRLPPKRDTPRRPEGVRGEAAGRDEAPNRRAGKSMARRLALC